MKTKLFALALLVTTATVVYGNNPIKIKSTNELSVFSLTYVGKDALKDVTIKVTDQQGHVMATRTVKSIRNFNLPLNFSSMDHGKYLVTVNDGTSTETQEIVYGNDSDKTKYETLLAHVAEIKTGQVLVTIPGNQVEVARITVLGSDESVLFTTTRNAINGTAVLLNTEKIQGPTTVVVTDEK